MENHHFPWLSHLDHDDCVVAAILMGTEQVESYRAVSKRSVIRPGIKALSRTNTRLLRPPAGAAHCVGPRSPTSATASHVWQGRDSQDVSNQRIVVANGEGGLLVLRRRRMDNHQQDDTVHPEYGVRREVLKAPGLQKR